MSGLYDLAGTFSPRDHWTTDAMVQADLDSIDREVLIERNGAPPALKTRVVECVAEGEVEVFDLLRSSGV
jgi:hypothetical protein